MSLISGANIDTDGLVLYIDTINPRFNADTPLTYDYSVWATGQTGSVGVFSAYSGNQNDRVIGTDPWGEDNVVWRSYSGLTTGYTYDSAGGIYCSSVSIDNTKLYRLSYWENRVSNGSATYGRYYFGCNGYGSPNGVGNLTNDIPNTNPYFEYLNHNAQPINTWVLYVGHIWPHTYDSTEEHVDSGRWEVDGTKIGVINTDYRWLTGTTTARPRTLAVFI
jgi:hypothetical protein